MSAISDSHVVVDNDFESDQLFLSEWGGYVVPKELWETYQAKKAELDTLAAQMTSGNRIDGYEQHGRERPPPGPIDELMFQLAKAMIPPFTPLRNRVPRTPGR